MTKYRLRHWMETDGQAVLRNASAVVWRGADRRFWLRLALHKLGWKLNRRRHPAARRMAELMLTATDSRDRPYTGWGPLMFLARRLLNTAADVEARSASLAAAREFRSRATG